MNYAEVILAIDPSVRDLCTRRYHGHAHGCPNHGKRAACPPRAPLITDELKPYTPTFVIWNRFAFAAHVARMHARHPGWTAYQLANCLYWQGTARKRLRASLEEFARLHPDYTIVTCPEAMGVNVTETMRSAGVELEWPPFHYAYQVAIAYIRADDAQKPNGASA